VRRCPPTPSRNTGRRRPARSRRIASDARTACLPVLRCAEYCSDVDQMMKCDIATTDEHGTRPMCATVCPGALAFARLRTSCGRDGPAVNEWQFGGETGARGVRPGPDGSEASGGQPFKSATCRGPRRRRSMTSRPSEGLSNKGSPRISGQLMSFGARALTPYARFHRATFQFWFGAV
jgi:hypothetical protein